VHELFNFITTAGPNLNPQTAINGIYSIPPAGGAFSGQVTNLAVKFFRQGEPGNPWPWTTYTAANDMALVWWDPNGTGPDENGTNATGVIRYIDDGKRYLPGQLTAGDPHWFDPNDPHSVIIYSKPPPSDQWPTYPFTQYYNNG
jgi:hypothetical protein